MKRSLAAHLDAISIDPELPEPLYRQLYFAVRDAILSGRLRPEQKVTGNPSTDLGLSRNTVVFAFDQLLAEGYTEGRTGAGTFVRPPCRKSFSMPVACRRGRSKRRPICAVPRNAALSSRLSAVAALQPRVSRPEFRNSRSFIRGLGPNARPEVAPTTEKFSCRQRSTWICAPSRSGRHPSRRGPGGTMQPGPNHYRLRCRAGNRSHRPCPNRPW